MKRVAWLTDIHLNFIDDPGRHRFAESVAATSADAVVVSGDIGESLDVARYLQEMAEVVRRPMYFVPGNHDFYRGSISHTRRRLTQLAAESEFLVYLTATDIVELTAATALVGHDGWGDARLGDFYGSDVLLSDFFLIEEVNLINLEKGDLERPRLEPILWALGEEAAEHFARVLPEAFSTYRRVIAVTHVPPFREAAWYDGKPSGEAWLPFFAPSTKIRMLTVLGVLWLPVG